jgi:hypothetical protein
MDYKLIFTMLAIYILLVSSIILIMLSIIGVTYFENPILIFSSGINFSIIFGCGIAISILLFAGIWAFLLFPRWKPNYFLTFPFFFVTHITYIVIARQESTLNYLEDWPSLWQSSPLVVELFQMRYKCCGWQNLSNIELIPCPHNFEWGCMKIVKDYLDRRFMELEIGSITGMGLGVISSIGLFIVAYHSPDIPLIARLTDE